MSTVEVAGGRVQGTRGHGGLAFLGVPYARAERWSSPEPVANWPGDWDASRPGPSAPQPDRAASRFTHGELPASDEAACLNLNVFTPALEGSRPVLVWIHGGGFAIGHGGASLYRAERLSQIGDLVVVTINYRLGSLGWLAHPALAPRAGAPAANWGLLDQIAALRWVRANVASFGGDPDAVTVAGQSAGALSVMDLMVAPGAEGLFSRAIIQSPPLMDVAQPMADGVRWAEALGQAALGDVSARFDPQALRRVDSRRLVELHEQLLLTPEFRGARGALPTIDPGTLPRSPAANAGASPGVEVLIGHNAQEGTFFFRSPWRAAPSPQQIPGIVAHLCHTEDPGSVLEDYRDRAARQGGATDDLTLLVDIATDAMVAEPLSRWTTARLQALGSEQGRVYRYRVDHPGAGPLLRATHTTEVPLVFGTWDDGDAGERLGGQAPGTATVAAQAMSSWTAFIHGGSPGWEPVTSAGGGLQRFGGLGGSAVEPF